MSPEYRIAKNALYNVECKVEKEKIKMLLLQTQAKRRCVIVEVTSHVTYKYVIGMNHIAYIYRVISRHRNWQIESAAWILDLRQDI